MSCLIFTAAVFEGTSYSCFTDGEIEAWETVQFTQDTTMKHRWFTEHFFHVQKDVFENDMPFLGSCGIPGPVLLPEDRDSGC